MGFEFRIFEAWVQDVIPVWKHNQWKCFIYCNNAVRNPTVLRKAINSYINHQNWYSLIIVNPQINWKSAHVKEYYWSKHLKNCLLLVNYSCLHFLPIPTPHPAEPISLPCFHLCPWFCPCVLYSSSCNPLSPLSPPHSPLAIVRLFLTSMSLVLFCLLFSPVDYVPVKGEIIWCLSLVTWLISFSIMLSSSIHAVAKDISSFFLSAA